MSLDACRQHNYYDHAVFVASKAGLGIRLRSDFDEDDVDDGVKDKNQVYVFTTF